jgi:hypothetical protein
MKFGCTILRERASRTSRRHSFQFCGFHLLVRAEARLARVQPMELTKVLVRASTAVAVLLDA